MSGGTRTRRRNDAVKQPPSPTSTPSEDETLPDMSADNTATTNAQVNQMSLRDDVSRLSQGLEPLTLGPYRSA